METQQSPSTKTEPIKKAKAVAGESLAYDDSGADVNRTPQKRVNPARIIRDPAGNLIVLDPIELISLKNRPNKPVQNSPAPANREAPELPTASLPAQPTTRAPILSLPPPPPIESAARVFPAKSPAPQPTQPVVQTSTAELERFRTLRRDDIKTRLQQSSSFYAKSKSHFAPVPDSEQARLQEKYKGPLSEMSKRMSNGAAGVLVYGAMGQSSDSQKLYVVRKEGESFSFLAETKVSTGAGGFGTTKAKDSHAKNLSRLSPKGFLEISQIYAVKPGQIIEKIPEYYIRTGKPFPPRFSPSPTGYKGHAHITSVALMLSETDPSIKPGYRAQDRSIAFHGSDREQYLGKKASNGCVRMSNIDAKILENIARQTSQLTSPDGVTPQKVQVYISPS